MIYIYALERAGVPFYVGKTKNIKARFSAHQKEHYASPDMMMTVLQAIADHEHAERMEAAWIWLYGQRYNLINIQHNRVRKVLPLHVLLDFEIDGATLADGWKRIS